jgi:NADPH2:quinone reductase
MSQGSNSAAMKAIVCRDWGPYGRLAIEDLPPPALGRRQVRIDVRFVALSFAQTLLVEGKYQVRPPLPFVPGKEISGVVSELGADVEGLKVGDRVAAAVDWGGFAQQAIASAATTWRVPDAVGLDIACFVPTTYGTSHAALHRRGRLQAGETLLVYGAAGGIGLPAVQLGRRAGARVIAVAGSDERVAFAMERGAHAGVVHGRGNLAEAVREANGGRNVDVVFDPVGGDLFDQALKCIQPEGRIITLGYVSGRIPSIPANILLVKNVDVIGLNFGLYMGWGPRDERERYKDEMQAMASELFAGVARGDLKPVSQAPYPMDDFVKAFDAVVERRSVGRVIVEMPRP